MDVDRSTEPGYTILRIKRKRNEEPLDALVVESRTRRKKARGGVDFFQFAQTVDDATWNDEMRQKEIQDEISRLARVSSDKTDTPSLPPPASPTVPGGRLGQTSTDRRYTILEPDASEKPASKKLITNDPKAAARHADFRLFDAVPYTDDKEQALDPNMEKIQDLLNSYLQMQDMKPDPEPAQSLVPTKDEDYVWDIFYRRLVPLGMLPSTGAIGTLTGPPPSFMYDSDSSYEEEEDEADEDSNAEDNYKNDYPEDEDYSDSSGDEFHGHSESEEYGYGDDSDHEWR